MTETKETNHSVKFFDELRDILEKALHDHEAASVMLQATRNILYSPILNDPIIFNDPRFESVKKEIKSLRTQYKKDYGGLLDTENWLRIEILVLKALSPLFEQTFGEIDSLRDALQNVGAENKEVKAKIEQREEVFKKIEEYTDAISNFRNELNKNKDKKDDKWRDHDTA